MTRQSEQLEHEAEETRFRLEQSLNELRLRATPGQLVDQIVDYAREGPVADFLKNLTREMRENPVPLLLMGVAITWLVLATSLSSRKREIADHKSAAAIPPAPDVVGPIKVAPVAKPQPQTERSRILTPADI